MSKLIHKKYVLHLSFIILLCVNSACLSKCPTNIYRKLSETELFGEWKATEDSLEFLQSNNICCADKEIKLTLSDDKRFTLTNMPSCWMDDYGTCVSNALDFEGTWAIDKTENNSNTLNLNGLTNTGVSLIKRNGEVQIVFWFGDPDAGKAVYLSK